MSYVRFSTNDYKCDLYVYQSLDGIVIHVAARRFDIPDDAYPPPMEALPPRADTGAFHAHVHQEMMRFREVSELVRDKPMKPIGGPFDGQTLTFSDHEEAAWWIEEKLAPLGIYNFPDDLAAALRADQETDDGD